MIRVFSKQRQTQANRNDIGIHLLDGEGSELRAILLENLFEVCKSLDSLEQRRIAS